MSDIGMKIDGKLARRGVDSCVMLFFGTKIDSKLARQGVNSYALLFWSWVARHIELGDKHQDQFYRVTATQSRVSCSEMWNRFDREYMIRLCGGEDPYLHANLLFKACYTWWSPAVHKIKGALQPGDPAQSGQSREHIPWLLSMNDETFRLAVEWAQERYTEQVAHEQKLLESKVSHTSVDDVKEKTRTDMRLPPTLSRWFDGSTSTDDWSKFTLDDARAIVAHGRSCLPFKKELTDEEYYARHKSSIHNQAREIMMLALSKMHDQGQSNATVTNRFLQKHREGCLVADVIRKSGFHVNHDDDKGTFTLTVSEW